MQNSDSCISNNLSPGGACCLTLEQTTAQGEGPAAHQEEHILAKFRAQRLEAGHATYGILGGPVQNQPCAASLAVLKYENHCLQEQSELT